MANNINCTCGHSWSKASSSKKDMNVCHICGKDNTMRDGGWLNKFEQGGMVLKQQPNDNYGKKANPNDVQVSVGPDFVGLGYNTKGRNYSPAWGGQFAMGGALPGAVGFTYARVAGSAPSNGKYAKKTKASAQNGQEMKFYQEGLDFTPKTISQNGSVIKDDMGQWAHPGEITEIGSNEITMQGVDYPVLGISDTGDTQMMYPDQDYKFDGEKVTEYPMMQNGGGLSRFDLETMTALEKDIKNQKARSAQETISQYTPKLGDQERMNAAKDAYRAEQAKLLNRAASSKIAANAMENIVEPMLAIEMGMGAGKLAKPALEAAGKYLTEKTALKNAYKLNPYAFKPTEGMMYRGLGKEGMEDALASGVFRAKQDVEPSMVGRFNVAKQFNKAYFSPKFKVADDYGQGYIAEVPRAASDWGKRYARTDWSQIAKKDIPTTEGKILKKDWLRGYKEVPKKENGGWLSKYQDGGGLVMDRFKEEKLPLDATRVSAPVKPLTKKEQKENVRINKQTQKNTEEYNKAVIADRKSKRETKGDLNVPGSFNIAEKARLFPESVDGVGEMFDEYINPGTFVGTLADSLGESIAAKSFEGLVATLAMTAGAGALGLDPLGGGTKAVKSFTKPSFADGKEALTYLNNVSDNIGEKEFLKTLIKKTGKTKEQLEVDFAAAIGNDATPKDPKVIINYANALRGKTNLPKLPKSLKELDEQAGKLVSPPSSSKFDNAEIVNRANEILEKGVGIKKKDIPVKLKVNPDMDNEIGVYVNDYNKSGYIQLDPNFSTVNKSLTFTDWLKGKKPTTVYDTYAKDQPAAMIKTGDFPYINAMSLEGTGVGAEAAEALKQALNEKGLQLYSSKSHTEAGKLRYLTEFLNNRKQVVDYNDNPDWMIDAEILRDLLGGAPISKKEVKEYMRQHPVLKPTQVRFQYDNGGWLNKYK